MTSRIHRSTSCPTHGGKAWRYALVLLLWLIAMPVAGAQQGNRAKFDHLTTGFELVGQHRDLTCESCHVKAQFKGTPRDCVSCHGAATAVKATAKPATHIVSSDRCDACHTPIAWKPAVKFDHAEVRGSCSSCHNGVQAQGKTPTHLQTDLECDACHTTIGWAGAIFTHADVVDNCASCHNNVSAKGQPPTHIPTAGVSCEDCHSNTNFASFAGTTMNHTAVAGVACNTCHEAGKSFFGVTIVTRPPAPHAITGDCADCHTNTVSFRGGIALPTNHIPTTQVCTLCHSNPADFGVYVMNHQGIAANCAQCHATGKSFANMAPPVLKAPPADHIPSGSTPCENCHAPENFTTFQIVNAVPPMNHAGFNNNCIACHGAGLSFAGTPPIKTLPANHIPTGSLACEGCHSSSDFSTFVIPNTSGAGPPSMVHTIVSSIACTSCHEAGRSFAGTPPVKTRPARKANGGVHVATGECSQCHNTTTFVGATDYPVNHLPLPGGAQSNCSNCHSNAGDYSIYAMDHSVVPGAACASCHAVGKSFANMAPPALKVPPANHIPFGTAACEACHSAADFNSFVITNKSPPMNHAAVASLTCNTCHARGLTFVGTPATVVEPANHIPSGATPCQNCHVANNFSSFQIANAVPPMNHSGFATNCISCHGAGLTYVGAPPVKLIPNNHVPTGTIACEGCHSNSNFNTFVIPNASGAAPPSMVHSLVTAIACSACHETGKSFVGTPVVKLRPALKANGQPHVSGGECSTCHLNTTSFTGATDLPANHIPLPAADNNNCALCHTTGNYTLYVMNHVNITNNCASCHAVGKSFANMAPPALKVPPTTPPAHIPFGTIACELCHSPNVFTSFSGTVMKHAPVRGMACVSCHERGMTWKTNTGVRLWVRPSGHHGTQDCGGSGCHSTRDKRGLRPGTATVTAALKAAGIAPRAASIAAVGASLTRAGGFDHRRVANQACASCHDQASGIGKPATHIASNNSCENCHTSYSWSPVSRVDHSAVLGKCSSCHDGTAAKGKSSRHFATAATCESCHTTNAWAPARFDHAAASPAACSSCHDTVRAIGKPTTHIPASDDCASCHGTLAWKPVKLDHSRLLSNCNSCHNGSSATGRPSTHMVTQRDCALCHSYADWSVIRFVHASAAYPGEHRAALSCASCHTSNTDQIPYTSPADAGSCGGCHAPLFKPDLHVKTLDGVHYAAGELRNCSGACHVYTDSTLATVSRSIAGPYHRVSDAAFKH